MDYTITDIKWERSNLILTLNKTIDNAFLVKEKQEIMITSNGNVLMISLTNINGTVLDKGIWHLKVNQQILTISPDLYASLDNFSRSFYYRNGFYSYNVDFNIEKKVFYIRIHFMMENHKYKKYIRICEGNTFLEKGKIFFKIATIQLLNLLYLVRHFVNIKNKKTILFLTENSDELTPNLKIMYKELKNSSYKLAVFCHNDFQKKCNFSYIKEVLFIAKSDLVLLEDYTPILNFIKINKSTKIIQLWHAGIGFKAVGYARFGKVGSPHPYYSCHRKYDYVIVDNENLINIYQEVFGIDKSKIKAFGIPRLDNFLNKGTYLLSINKIYNMNPNLKIKKTILFAPTYRGQNQSEAFYDMNILDLNKISQFCIENNFIFIIKMHPFIKKTIEINNEYKEIIKDFSNENIDDLMYVTDILITDYSSCAYEFSMLHRPIIFFRYDKNQYEFDRPMHGLNNIKGIEVTNFDDLMYELEKIKKVDVGRRLNNLSDAKNRNSIKKIKGLIEKELED